MREGREGEGRGGREGREEGGREGGGREREKEIVHNTRACATNEGSKVH